MKQIKHRSPLEFLEREELKKRAIRVLDPVFNNMQTIKTFVPVDTYVPPYSYLLPSGLDLHVHFREPGFTHKEDFTTGSIAALAGGISFTVDMPNTKPPTTTPERLNEKRKLRDEKSYIPVLLAGGLTHTNYDDIEILAKETPILKAFIATSFGELSIEKEQFIHALKKLDKMDYNGIIYLHCEDPKFFHPEFDDDPRDYWKVRPEISEIECFKKHLKIAKQFPHLSFQFTHTTSPYSAQLVLDAMKAGLNVNLDVTITHIDYDKDTPCLQPWKLKMNPPLRERKSVSLLRKMMFQGIIPYTASDHAPHTIEEKTSKNIPPGNPGVQETYHYFIDKSLKGIVPWKTTIKVVHDEPIRRIKHNYYENNIQVILDPNQNTYVDVEWIKSKVKWSLWEGRNFKGKIIGLLIAKNKEEKFYLPIEKLPKT